MDASNLDTISLYKGILDGRITRFPPNYWRQPGVEKECAELVHYLFDVVLKWNDNEITEKADANIFRKYKLSGILAHVFDGSPFSAIDNAYPGKFHAWEFNCVPDGYWEKQDNIISALRWLLDSTGKHKFTELSNRDFLEHKLGGLMDNIQRNGLYDSLDIDKIEDGFKLGTITRPVSFFVRNTKSRRNHTMAQLEIPVSFLDAINVSPDHNGVSVSIKDGAIMIKSLDICD